MALVPGTRIGPYQVGSLIGAGAMGEVYRATDTKLKRSVAVKVLPAAFASDRERLARFQREAEVLASLNHANVAQIHGLEETGGSKALVMELVEGPTLAARIADGPLPVDEAVAIAKQIVEALEAAHEKGIVHRDLKPANIKISPEGRVKVLDFGLAKALGSLSAAEEELGRDARSQATTVTASAATMHGAVMGTPAYMSPEQVRGSQVDRRADIWAFGCVLYEMLTGRRAFSGATTSDVLAGVLERVPDFGALPPDTRPAIRRLIARCLEKDARNRLRDIGDARFELEDAPASSTETVTPSPIPSRHSRRAAALFLGLGVVAGGIAAGALLWVLRAPPAPARVVRMNVSPRTPGVLIGKNGIDPDVAISPDGARIVYLTGLPGAQQLYVRDLDQLEPRRLEGLGRAPRGPFLSPDGGRVGFFEGRALKTVAVGGGPVLTVCEIDGDPRGASWGSDGTIVFATANVSTGLFRVSASGGKPEPLTTPESGGDPQWPQILPGGEAVLFSVPASGSTELAVFDTRTHQTKRLLRGGSHPRYVPTGHLLYGFADTLWAVAFDVGGLEVRGDPVPVVRGIVTKGSGAASFSVAADGSLVYLTRGAPAAERTLTWIDRQGREEPLAAPPRRYADPRISPDGTHIAVVIEADENDIWILDLARGTLKLLTVDPGVDMGPLWTPDGRRIAFWSNRTGVPNLFWQAVDGVGSAEPLTRGHDFLLTQSFAPDGKHLVVLEVGPDNDLYLLSVEDRKTAPLIVTPFFTRNAAVSPDGHWMAYVSNESGEFEVYVRPFPEVNEGELQQVSSGGGLSPAWNPLGNELFYLTPQGAMMAVPIRSSPAAIEIGSAARLFDWPQEPGGFEVSRDGRRFLTIAPAAGQKAVAPEIEVVLNWFDELERLVPTD